MTGRRHRAALDLRTPLRGHGKHQKKSNNNQLAVGDVDGLQGVMEVTPYDPDPNYGRAAALDCRKPFAPFSWIKKYPQQIQTTIKWR